MVLFWMQFVQGNDNTRQKSVEFSYCILKLWIWKSLCICNPFSQNIQKGHKYYQTGIRQNNLQIEMVVLILLWGKKKVLMESISWCQLHHQIAEDMFTIEIAKNFVGIQGIIKYPRTLFCEGLLSITLAQNSFCRETSRQCTIVGCRSSEGAWCTEY